MGPEGVEVVMQLVIEINNQLHETIPAELLLETIMSSKSQNRENNVQVQDQDFIGRLRNHMI